MFSFECANITWVLSAVRVWSQNYKKPPVKLVFASAYIEAFWEVYLDTEKC